MCWNAIEKFSSQGISFIVSIVMARLLTPAEYGIIGIIGVFIGISSVFINSGISYALIARTNCSLEDYCTANWINIGISILCYLLLFITSPLIARFYELPLLVSTIRVMTLCFIFGAIAGVSRTKLNKDMKFKQLSIATLVTSIFSGIIGIVLAYLGFGVWALVYQTVLSALFSSIWVIVVSGFIPKFIFSIKSFWSLFSFGGKILGSDIIWAIYRNIYPLIIGKGFNAQSVGYFTRASAYSSLIPNNCSGILESVLFPAFASVHEEERTLRLYEKALTISSLLIFTGNFFLLGLAYPLVLNMISAKWLPCVPLLQIFCLATMFNHIQSINGRLFIVKGFPGIFLKISAVFQPVKMLIIIISVWFGLEAIVWGEVFASILGLIYNCYIFRRTLGINPLKCLHESYKIFIWAGFIGMVEYTLFKNYIAPSFINLILIAILMGGVYLIGIKVFMPQLLTEVRVLLK